MSPDVVEEERLVSLAVVEGEMLLTADPYIFASVVLKLRCCGRGCLSTSDVAEQDALPTSNVGKRSLRTSDLCVFVVRFFIRRFFEPLYHIPLSWIIVTLKRTNPSDHSSPLESFWTTKSLNYSASK